MKKIILALAMAGSLPVAVEAQNNLGIATGNWSGTNSLYLNPANIADSRHRFTIDLFSVSAMLDNNSAKIQTSKLSDLFSNDGQGTGLKFGNEKRISLMLPSVEMRGPGAMVSINRKHSVALTTRIRLMNQVHNFNQMLYNDIVDSSFVEQSAIVAQAGNFNWTANLWSEIGASYAGVIWENNMHQIKGGFTARYLRGTAYISATSSNLDLQYDPNQAVFQATNTDIRFASNIINKNGLGVNDANDLVSRFTDKSIGSGFGADLGLTYEFRPNWSRYTYNIDGKTGVMDNSKNKYLFRISAAVVDLGAITYKGAENNTLNFTGNGRLRGNDIADSIRSVAQLKAYAENNGFSLDTASNVSTKVYMPTRLIAGLDFHLHGNFYANVTYIQNVAKRIQAGNTYYNQVTVTPRWDSRWFSVGVPLTFSSLSSSIKAGIGIRAAGFFFGSDDALAFLSDNQYGAGFYAGAYVPINKRRKKDSDNDGVSNRYDKCRGEKGDWANKGCPNPDADGDGILDKDDACPDIEGEASASGCPDADGDGISDEKDLCPDQPGSAGLQGCPDRDRDGIADSQDECPDQPGIAAMKGCPDTDKDGISDKEDQCPEEPGNAANAGCPDTDGDGIADNIDKCPTQPGTPDNFGCPEVTEATRKRLGVIGGAIQFETGKAIIKKVSFIQLDEVVKIMNDNMSYNMQIEGHTDNVGKPANNMTLSENRANAVKEYLLSRGIDAGRLSAKGMGDTAPIADNKTPAGKAKNRRVQMTLVMKK